MRPYHTPKSERDEKLGALAEAEQIEETRFSGTFVDANNDSTDWDFKAASEADAVRMMELEALGQRGIVLLSSGGFHECKPGGPFPHMGPVYGMMLYSYDTQNWVEVPVPEYNDEPRHAESDMPYDFEDDR